MTGFPPMPAFITETRFPYAACNRRDKAFGHRSSPFNVDAVPSVMDRKATTTEWRPGHDVERVEEVPGRRRERRC